MRTELLQLELNLKIIHLSIFLLITGFSTIMVYGQYQPDTSKTEVTSSEEDSESAFLLYEGMKISRIIINPIDVAGPSIDKYNGMDSSWLGKIANALHFKTRDWVIRQRLLFAEGDLLEARLISESERLLRGSGYFLDANIKTSDIYDDSLTILVTTKDRWTITLNLSYSIESESYFGLKDENLLGLGHSFDAAFTHDPDPQIGFGGRANYTAHNVAGTFINAGTDFRLTRKYNIQSLFLTRPFISTELDYVGGVEFRKESNKLLYLDEQITSFLPYKILAYDVWGGRSLPVWFGDNTFRNKTRFIISARVSKVHHTEKPEHHEIIDRLFKNSIIYLAKGGIINRRFYKDYWIDRFGQTEDVPLGGKLSFTAGSENRESETRIYTGITGSLSRRINGFGYTSMQLEVGGFKRGDLWEQNTFGFNLLYHSMLFRSNSWRHRLFIQADYLLGFNRFTGEQIFLNEDTGIRGIKGTGLYGIKRGIINLEWRSFSPYSILGFLFGSNIYADFGLISRVNQNLAQSRLYQAYGAGLRISNESIARARFEIGLIYNPVLPDKPSGGFSVMFSTGFLLGIRNIDFSPPAISRFQDN